MEPRRILVVDDDPDTRALVRRAIAAEFPHSDVREASHWSTLAATLVVVSALLGSLLVATLLVVGPGQAAPLDRGIVEQVRPIQR